MKIDHAIEKIFGSPVRELSCVSLGEESGVSNRVASARSGVFGCHVSFKDGSERRFIGKRKSVKIIINGIRLLCDGDVWLFLRLVMCHKILGYNRSSVRESILYSGLDTSLRTYLPDIIGSYVHPVSNACFLAMEELPCTQPPVSELHRLIDIITEFHVRYYGDEASAKELCVNRYTSSDYRSIRYSLKKMLMSLEDNCRLFGEDKTVLLVDFIRNIHKHHAEILFHRTLTHNDYTIRNISCDGDDIRVFDWELACYQNPEHDLVELLASVMHHLSDDEVLSAMEHQRSQLAKGTGVTLSDEQYRRVMRFSVLEYAVNKLSMLRLADKHLSLGFTDQLAVNTARLMDLLDIEKE